MARNQDDIKLKARKVTIREFRITGISMPEGGFKVSCSKGTYIRSLARDFGKALGSGAYLTNLRRTRIGQFEVSEALTVQDFLDRMDALYPENS